MKEKRTKSEMFREMFDQGYSIAEIAKETNNYYSFVHRVIRAYEKELGISHAEPAEPAEPTELNGSRPSKKDIRKLHKQNKNVDDIMEELNLPEEERSYVYSTIKKFKKTKEANANVQH